MNSGRGSLTMVLALLLAAAAAAGVYMFSNAAQEPEPTTQPAVVTPTVVPTTEVLVVRRDIAAETVVTADMVEVKQVALGEENARALTTPEEAIGKVTTAALAQGEQVLSIRLTDEVVDRLDESETYAYEVPVGKRAVSVTYDEVMGAGALIQPGDKVDVIGLFADMSAGELAESTTEGQPAKVVEVESGIEAVTYVVQDVEVLAVAQALTSGDAAVAGVDAEVTPTPTPDPDATATVDGTDVDRGSAAVARPTAKSVTLAVSPEEAQRLLLASQTATLRLALRSPGDTTISPPLVAQSGVVPIGLENVNTPLVPTNLAITEAEFTRRSLSVGEVLEFKVTLKNVSIDDTTIIETTDDAAPGFTYTQGTAYDALGFEGDQGTYRLGLNVEGAYPTPFPYRWGLGRDVKPGESIEVTGSVRLTEPTTATQYWFGVIVEGGEAPDLVIQDGMGAVDIAVSPASAVTVEAATAELRVEPSDSAAVAGQVSQGERLTVLESQGDWFRVKTAENVEGWIPAVSVAVVQAESPATSPETSPVASPAASPVATPAGT